jgi:hypothetical protein
MKWSPDGRVLALLGRQPEIESQKMPLNNDSAEVVEFYDAATGRRLSTVQPDNKFSLNQKSFWVSDGVFVLWDKDTNYKPVLNFIDSQTGKTLERLKLPEHLGESDSISTDSTNSLWAFASMKQGWEVLTREQILEAAHPANSNVTSN